MITSKRTAIKQAHSHKGLCIILAGILKRFTHVGIKHGVDHLHRAITIDGVAHIAQEITVAEGGSRTRTHEDVSSYRGHIAISIHSATLVIVEDTVLEIHCRVDEVGNSTLARSIVSDTTVFYRDARHIIKCHGSTRGHRSAVYHLCGTSIGFTDGETIERGVLSAIKDQQMRHIEVIDILRFSRDGGHIDVRVASVKTRASEFARVTTIDIHIARNLYGGGADASHDGGIGIVDSALLHIHIDLDTGIIVLCLDVGHGSGEEAHRIIPTTTDGRVLRTFTLVRVNVEIIHLVAVSISGLFGFYSS